MKKYQPTPKHEIIQYLNETEQNTIIYDNLDNALIGIGNQHTKPPIAIYSLRLIIETLINDGLTYEEAIEYTDYNITGAWLGEQTPLIINDLN